ncbi:stalk domain-containing protein [Cohnella faecalis]|uniref:Uncharacterized protein n=1 Tax=Cohnella faecalis TaxID=2315694 RepID=A0A398CN42_9BACL|nr:stalk domain-containing protein [Cohnella faecalis]RIE02208.1 hypothetical protein D3H35_15835 [Cohnella faecalis]
MKKTVVILLFLLTLLSVNNRTSFAADLLPKANSQLTINGAPFKSTAPLLSKGKEVLVPLKDFVTQLKLNLEWNTEYSGYRINSLKKVILVMPNSKLANIKIISEKNYKSATAGITYEFASKIERMPAALIRQNNVQYISLQWLCKQLELKLQSNNSSLIAAGEVAPATWKNLTPLYETLKKKYEYDYFSSDLETFMKYEFNAGVNRGFIEVENKQIIALIGKKIWTNYKDTATDLTTNKVITLPRLSQITITDELSGDETIITYKNKLYKISNSFALSYFKKDPQKEFKWSAKVWNAIKEEEVFIGMTTPQALMSWGEPDDINTTTTEYGIFEQWVYGYSYLYFQNGKLTTIQN